MKHSTNYTKGIWAIALPMMLSNLSVPLLGMVDTAMMGQLGDPAYLGGLSISATLFSFLFWGLGFLKQGTTALVAQKQGNQEHEASYFILLRACFLGISLGIVLLLLQKPIVTLAMYLFKATETVESHAAAYFSIRIWSGPAALANFAILGYLLGQKRAHMVLLLQVLLNGLNIVLDLFFVLGLSWDIQGVAAATVIAEYVCFFVGIGLCYQHSFFQQRLDWKNTFFRKEVWKQLVLVNRDIFIRTLFLLISFAYFTNESAKISTVLLAANAVLLQFQTFAAYFLDGFAHAIEVLVGHEVGQKKTKQVKSLFKQCAWWGGGFAVLLGLVFVFAGPTMFSWFTRSKLVLEAIQTYSIWLVILPFISVWSFLLDGLFLGTLQTRRLRNGMVISSAVFLVFTQLFLHYWENHGLWFSFVLFMGLRAVTLIHKDMFQADPICSER